MVCWIRSQTRGEAAFECGFPLAELGVDRVVAVIEQLGDLVDAEQSIGVENEDEQEFTRSEDAVCKRRISGVREAIAAVAAPDSGTVVPSLEEGFTTLGTGSLFPRALTAPLDDRVERFGAEHYCLPLDNLLQHPAESCPLDHNH